MSAAVCLLVPVEVKGRLSGVGSLLPVWVQGTECRSPGLSSKLFTTEACAAGPMIIIFNGPTLYHQKLRESLETGPALRSQSADFRLPSSF